MEGRVFVVASAFKSFILKLDIVASIFLNILVLLSFSPLTRNAGVFEIFLIALKKKPKMAGCESDVNRKIDKGILLNYVRRMASEDMRHKAIALTN